MTTTLGTLAIACAAFNDVVDWVILGTVTAITRAGTLSDTVVSRVGIGAYAVVMVVVVRPALAAAFRRRGGSGVRAPEVLAVLVLVFVSAYVTDRLGIQALFGAFLSGALMPRSADASRDFAHRIEPAVTSWLLPLFFASSGLRTSLPLISGASLWADTAIILAVAVAGKGLGSGLAAWSTGLRRRDAAAIGYCSTREASSSSWFSTLAWTSASCRLRSSR